MKINLACGLTKLNGYVNVDANPEVKPDEVVNVGADFLPWKDQSCEEVVFFHAIEHIEKKYHATIFTEIHRILTPGGRLLLGYPEFGVCCKFWLENHLGKRDFWEACIYGRQCDPKDFHVSAMHTPEVMDLLRNIGFEDVAFKYEEDNPQYAILKAVKSNEKPLTYEETVNELIFRGSTLRVSVADSNNMVGS